MTALGLLTAITLLDQWTKLAVRRGFALGESVPVWPGFFHLTYLRNTGAAWGVLGGQNTALILLSIAMLALMLRYRRHFLADTASHRIALGLLLGGITGNLLDRVRLGYVVDFLDFFAGPHHWPAFNVADAAICCGVGLYLLTSWRGPDAANAAKK